MKTKLIIFVLWLLSWNPLLSFDKRVDTVVISYDTCQVEQTIVTITNTEAEPLWIWFDDRNDYKSDSEAIKLYLMKRIGDFSIFDIGTDPNMIGSWWSPSAPNYVFVKYLESDSCFTIILYRKTRNDSLSCESSVDETKSIKIFNNRQIIQTCAGFDAPNSFERISYPHDVIVFPIN